MPRRSRFATRRQLEYLRRDVKKRFATKGQQDYLKRDIKKKAMLNGLDAVLLSVVSFIGLLFSVIQALPGDWDKFLAFFPLLIVGWVFPLLIYSHRIIHPLPLKKSLISHFKSWAYFGHGLAGYATISIAFLLKLNTIQDFIVMVGGVFVASILFVIAVLRIGANRLFISLFGYRNVPRYRDIFPPSIVVFSMVLFSFSSYLFAAGYILYTWKLISLNRALILGIIGLILFISNFATLAYNEKMLSKRKMRNVLIGSYVILGLICFIIFF